MSTTLRPSDPQPGSASPAIEIVEPEPESHHRVATDVIRAATAFGLFAAVGSLPVLLPGVVTGVESDVDVLVNPTSDVRKLAVGVGTVSVVFAPVAIAAILVTVASLRVTAMVFTSFVASFVSLAISVSVRDVGSSGFAVPDLVLLLDGIYLVVGGAVATTLSPWTTRTVRRVGVGALAFVTLSSVASGLSTVYEVTSSLTLGWLVGSLVILCFGSPNRAPRAGDVAVAMQHAGHPLHRIEYRGRDPQGLVQFIAVDEHGDRLDIDVYDESQRHADRLARTWHWLRVRDPSADPPFSSIRRSVEHEALVSLKALDDGVPTPMVRTLTELGDDSMLIAFDHGGQPLLDPGDESHRTPDDQEGSPITDEDVRGAWNVLADLRRSRIAHRDLRLERFERGAQGAVMIRGLRAAELAASDTMLRTDVVELLCATALAVGPEHAVRVSIDALGPDPLVDALPRLQPIALTGRTRKAIARAGLLDPLRDELQRQLDVEEVEYENLARVKPRTLVTVIVLALALYVLLPRVADVGVLRDEIGDASWGWLLGVVAFEAITYLGAAIAISSSVPDRISLFGCARVQVAAAFVDIVSPHSIGGMALNTRYLQKQGVEAGTAVAGVGLNAIAGVAGHVLLFGAFVLWTGSEVESTDAPLIPAVSPVLLLPLLVVVLLLFGFSRISIGRRLLDERVWPVLRDAYTGVRVLARNPAMIAGLLGGSMLTTLGFTGSFVCAVLAFGGGVSIPAAATVYLASWAVASIAPTPGGLGALELALIAGLNRLGMSADTAVSTVLVFRTITLWLPVLPGWITFQWLQHRREI